MCKRYLLHIFLTAYEGEHILMCLLALWISLSVKLLFLSFVDFNIFCNGKPLPTCLTSFFTIHFKRLPLGEAFSNFVFPFWIYLSIYILSQQELSSFPLYSRRLTYYSIVTPYCTFQFTCLSLLPDFFYIPRSQGLLFINLLSKQSTQ